MQQEMEEQRRKLAEEAYARQTLNREPTPAEPELTVSKDTALCLHLRDMENKVENEILTILAELCETVLSSLNNFMNRGTRDNPLNDHLLAGGNNGAADCT